MKTTIKLTLSLILFASVSTSTFANSFNLFLNNKLIARINYQAEEEIQEETIAIIEELKTDRLSNENFTPEIPFYKETEEIQLDFDLITEAEKGFIDITPFIKSEIEVEEKPLFDSETMYKQWQNEQIEPLANETIESVRKTEKEISEFNPELMMITIAK